MIHLTAVIVLAWCQAPTVEPLTEGLAIRAVGRSGRIPFPTDAVQALIASRAWKAPEEGQTIALPSSESRAWTSLRANPDGSFSQSAFQGGYACFVVRRAKECVEILEASGHGMVYVNGEPRAGDPYGFGYLKLPVLLKKGENELLFSSGRGAFRARLVQPKAEVYVAPDDPTLPDYREGGKELARWGAVVLVNASRKVLKGLKLTAIVEGTPLENEVPTLQPSTIFKVPFRLPGEGAIEPKKGTVKLSLVLSDGSEVLDRAEFDLRVRAPAESFKATFRSDIDGSVQYYGVMPCSNADPQARPALILSLHGAGVEAIGQADAYGPKDWAYIVCPTNRRPFGFDWEDWGRLDALEVLGHARLSLGTDPQRQFLTGHSMGGHGVWQIGALFPGEFAAIGPSAGWRSFFTYAGGSRPQNPDAVASMFEIARLTSDTEAFARNYVNHAVYVLHGTADDNVPVREARAMRDLLQPWHPDFHYHEQQGASHWWDDSDAPGAACVDWPPMMALFQSRAPVDPWSATKVEFATANPAVSSQCGFVQIAQLGEPMSIGKVSVSVADAADRFNIETANVTKLRLWGDRRRFPMERFEVVVDGQRLECAPPVGGLGLELEKVGEIWRVSEFGERNLSAQVPPQKGGAMLGLRGFGGPFKNAFQGRMVFVFGTRGTAEERAWAAAKARFDAETFYYRGNGAPEVLSDSEFLSRREETCNVVLYGNQDTNAAWSFVLGDAPLTLRRGLLRLGERVYVRSDLGALFLWPRKRTLGTGELVAVVGGTGVGGMRLTDRLPYFLSGVQYPDWCVFDTAILTNGTQGVLGAGFFGNDWAYSPRLAAWRN